MNQETECAANDYFISPGYALESGKTYTVEYYAFEEVSTGAATQLSLELGTSTTDMSTFTKLTDITLPDNSTYPSRKTHTFTCSANGTYYVAFHCTSPVNNNYIYLLEFNWYEGEPAAEVVEEPETKTVPYSVDLKTDYSEWTAADNNSDTRTWTPVSGEGPMLGMALSTANDDDYFSPKIKLTGGVSYKITTVVAVDNAPAGNDIVTLTQGTDKTAMTAIKQLSLTTAGENTESNIFTPATDGEYYFSFHNTSLTGGNTLSIYSFAIEEYVEETPDKTDVFVSDFSELGKWTIIDANADGVKWGTIDGYNGPSYSSNKSAADDWIITPAITMTPGTDYLITYSVSQAGAFDADVMEVKWGTLATVGSLSNLLATETIDLESGTMERTIRMTATKATVYIGFHLTTSGTGVLTLNSVTVSETSKPVPMPVENLSASSDASDKSVTLKWRNPAYDTSNALIGSGLGANIYANGVKIHSMSNLEPGEDATYTYNPESFSGKITYRVMATLGDTESRPQEIALDLDDVQGDIVLVQEFPLPTYTDGTMEWVIEDANGDGKTWESKLYSGILAMPTLNQAENNDWAITKAVQLEAGKRYVVNFEVKTTRDYPGTLYVWLGNAQTNTSMSTQLMSLVNIQYNSFTATATPQFSVATSGTYYIGFQAGNAPEGMQLTNVNICVIEPRTSIPVMSLPYEQLFDESTLTPSGWSIGNSNNDYGFTVCNPRTGGSKRVVNACSAPNALFAKTGAPDAKESVIYTPKFSFEPGKTYAIGFVYNMFKVSPNETDNVISLYKATDHKESAWVGEPMLSVSALTGFSDYEAKSAMLMVTETTEYCFAIRVTSAAANACEVIIDNFTVAEKEVTSGLSVSEQGNMHFAQAQSLLFVPENVELVRIFDVQGRQVMAAANANGSISLAGLSSGMYVANAITAAGETISLKVIKK